MIFWSQVIKVAIAIFIITDSLGNIPFFISLTEGSSPKERNKIILTAIFTGLFLLAFFVFAGNLIFDLFSLTIEDIQIAGGILLLFISTQVLIQGKVLAEHREEVGVMPLGSPLLVGPGAITTALVMARIYDLSAVTIGVLICFILIWLVLRFSGSIYRIIGRNGALIITRIAAILIAAIAVRFIRVGITAIFGL
jgi:multiple antibiotic resistance protein